MASKRKLLINNDYDFLLFGISCGEKLYRICWALNGQLKVSFAKGKDMEIAEKTQAVQTKFPVFSFRDEETLTEYRVILNRTENKFLIPEYKQADYVLMIQGGIPYSEKNNILKKIKEVAFVQTAFQIDPQKIKSKDSFVF
jgi:hypothetical protein